MLKITLKYGPTRAPQGDHPTYAGCVTFDSVEPIYYTPRSDGSMEDLLALLSTEVKTAMETDTPKVVIAKQRLGRLNEYVEFELDEDAVELLLRNPAELARLYSPGLIHLDARPQAPVAGSFTVGVSAIADAFGDEVYISYDPRRGLVENPFTGRWGTTDTLPEGLVWREAGEEWVAVETTSALRIMERDACVRFWAPRRWARPYASRVSLEQLKALYETFLKEREDVERKLQGQ